VQRIFNTKIQWISNLQSTEGVQIFTEITRFSLHLHTVISLYLVAARKTVKGKKVKQSHYRPGQTLRVPGG